VARTHIIIGLALALLLASFGPAQAMSCQSWDRLDDGRKRATIDQMIESAIAGEGGRSLSVNRGAIRRCMQNQSEDMLYAFDDTCADSRTASMQAINRIFKDFIWSCVG
jgi:hypothetical protein